MNNKKSSMMPKDNKNIVSISISRKKITMILLVCLLIFASFIAGNVSIPAYDVGIKVNCAVQEGMDDESSCNSIRSYCYRGGRVRVCRSTFLPDDVRNPYANMKTTGDDNESK